MSLPQQKNADLDFVRKFRRMLLTFGRVTIESAIGMAKSEFMQGTLTRWLDDESAKKMGKRATGEQLAAAGAERKAREFFLEINSVAMDGGDPHGFITRCGATITTEEVFIDVCGPKDEAGPGQGQGGEVRVCQVGRVEVQSPKGASRPSQDIRAGGKGTPVRPFSPLRLPPHADPFPAPDDEWFLPPAFETWKGGARTIIDGLELFRKTSPIAYECVLERLNLSESQFELLKNIRPIVGPETTYEEARGMAGLAPSHQAAQMVIDGTAPTQTAAAEMVGVNQSEVSRTLAKGEKVSEAVRLIQAGEVQSMAEAAELVGVSVPAVVKGMGENFDSKKNPIIPDHLKSAESRADFLKLTLAGQERVRAKEPLNKVALEEGVRSPPDHLKLAKKHFSNLTTEQRDQFDDWRKSQ